MPNRKKPIEQKLMEGTYRQDRDGDYRDLDIIKKQILNVDIPKSLKNKKTKNAWINTVNPLCTLGLISEQDITLLETAFISLESFYNANSELNKAWKRKKVIIKNGDGTEEERDSLDVDLINSLNLISNRSLEMFQKIITKFGVTPIDRTKLLIDFSTIKKNESLASKMTED